ncbi:unnamed protein product (macronuclear) [Paramecium tetraurelia]|uniref:Transmembrane protein n=1 Tax=Paramecium tetraurelia TaxID=5888 RepID=A0DIU0_PARTE|nr:uncharacterized protein GSPATT00017314001 [Paramecium tetraurelia]CAK82957.1 unnamed protein product [Paramecium tetraurelia]|eukprot:XP_001450354.1 hypothetical protein (macronuclear) [Paramecium tetraurelia strain d4-2]
MIHNLLIIVFFALWTFLFILLILIGYFLEKKYKLAAITPEVKQQTPQDSVVYINHMLISNIQKQSQQKNDSQLVEELVSNQRTISQQKIQEQVSKNEVKIEYTSTQKESTAKVQQMKANKQQKQTPTQTIFSRKPIIGILEGMDTLQSTNRKSVRSRQSANNSERNSVFGSSLNQQHINQAKIHSSSTFQTNGNLLGIQNDQIPKPAKEYYKCNSFAKIFYSHKIGLSRIFMLSQIYFRQMLCFEICGALLLFDSQLQYYYIMGSSCGAYMGLKIFDYYMIKCICKDGRGCLVRLISYLMWASELAILVLGIMYYEVNNFICLQYYAPSLVLELFIIDPMRYFLIKNCQAQPRIIINKKSQIIK